MKIGGSIGKALKKVASTKLPGGVSLGGGVGSMMGPLGAIAGSRAGGVDPAQDFKRGAVQAAAIFGASKMAGGADGMAPPDVAQAGDPAGGFVDQNGLKVTGRDQFGNKIFDTSQTMIERVVDQDGNPIPPDVLAAERGAPTGPSGGRFRSVADFLGKNAGSIAGAAGDAYMGYRQDQRESDLFNRGKNEWNRRAPLRARASELLLDDSRPDLSSLTADPALRFRKVNVGSR